MVSALHAVCGLAATAMASPRAPAGEVGREDPVVRAVERLGLAVERTWPVPGGTAVAARGDTPDGEAGQEDLLETLMGVMAAAGADAGIELWVGPDSGELRRLAGTPLGEVVPTRSKPWGGAPGRAGRGGALAGRRVAVSAGHGWLADGAGWTTQRYRWEFEGCGGCRGVVEDFLTAEIVSRQLIPLLLGMGAEVVAVRAPDLSEAPAVAMDDGDPGVGLEGAWALGVSAGGWQGDYRTLAPAEAGAATWLGPVATMGSRLLAVRFRHGENRTASARWIVDHAGGSTVVAWDQRRTGWGWLHLGAFWFTPDDGLRVRLEREDADGYLIADGVMAGGGMHDEANRPWWQMAAESYVPWSGAPAESVFGGDVTIRPRYAEHMGADLYVSVHANASGQAGGSGANGLSVYRHSCGQYADFSRSETAVGCDHPPGSARLAALVQAEAVDRARADWDPGFGDRSARVANFGELRELVDAPGVLVETAFFDNVTEPVGDPPPRFPDNRSLHDPRFREALALGIGTALARFWDADAPALPGRPDGLAATEASGLTWRPVEGATGYRVYRTAAPGPWRAWDDGRVVGQPALMLDDGLAPPGRVVAFRVAALNSTGEGFPSAAVAFLRSGAAADPGPSALLITAYDRRDAWVQDEDNDLSYALEHAHAMAAAGLDRFDGALDERVAVSNGAAGDALRLADYRFVDYAAGKDSTEHLAVGPEMRQAIRAFVEQGGALIMSGEEIGWQMVERSDDPAEVAYLAEVMGATYLEDDAEALELRADPQSPSPSLAALALAPGPLSLDDGTQGVYEVRYPDVWAPVAPAIAALTYPDGRAAAVATPRTVLLGAPLEAVVPDAARTAVTRAFLAHLGIVVPADVAPDGRGEDGGPGRDAGEGEGSADDAAVEGEGPDGRECGGRQGADCCPAEGGCGADGDLGSEGEGDDGRDEPGEEGPGDAGAADGDRADVPPGGRGADGRSAEDGQPGDDATPPTADLTTDDSTGCMCDGVRRHAMPLPWLPMLVRLAPGP